MLYSKAYSENMPRTVRPRIALFSGNFNYVRDGANQALNKLVAYAQQSMDADIRVYAPTTATPAFPPSGQLISVPSIPLPGRAEYRLAAGLTRLTRRDLEQFAPQIVHLSAPDWLGTAALKWAKARAIPVVTSVHTRFETYLTYYRLAAFKPMLEKHLKSFYRQSDYLLVPNMEIGAEMSAKSWSDNIRIWGRGVDRNLFNPAFRDPSFRSRVGATNGEIIIVFFGRIVLEKGVDRFADVIRRLRKNGARIKPLVIGDGPARAHFAEGMPDAHFTGCLQGEELGRALASADIALMPSTTEAFGNVVLEAMAAGLAVVAANAGSTRALIDDGRTGFLCADEVEDYCAVIQNYLDDHNLITSIGAAARAASVRFSWPETLDAVTTVYGELLERQGLISVRQEQEMGG